MANKCSGCIYNVRYHTEEPCCRCYMQSEYVRGILNEDEKEEQK